MPITNTAMMESVSATQASLVTFVIVQHAPAIVIHTDIVFEENAIASQDGEVRTALRRAALLIVLVMASASTTLAHAMWVILDSIVCSRTA